MKKIMSLIWWAAALAVGCTDGDGLTTGDTRYKIALNGEIEQDYVTRANDQGFADGDVIGVYIVDYNGTLPGTLQASGNRATNLAYTYAEKSNSWTAAGDIYWKDNNTPIDIYGYYPIAKNTPKDIHAYEFSVASDQSVAGSDYAMGGYEQSDLLWGKVGNVAPTSQTIRLPLRHHMSTARIELTEGSGFTAGEFARMEKSVVVKNTGLTALVDLSNGSITTKGEAEATDIVPYENNGQWRCIIVPQTVEAGKELFAISIDSKPYTFSRDDGYEYKQGRMHHFTIRIDKKEEEEGKYRLTLTGERITPWENDDVSHDATMKEYIIINSRAGRLRESIMAGGHDFRELRNLKITGEVNAKDFYFMRDSMNRLQSLNMKEMLIQPDKDGKRRIPNNALHDKQSLIRMVLPDRLDEIDTWAFANCQNLTGSLLIPEGVTYIANEAFQCCGALTGTLSLPSTLERIGDDGGYNGPFNGCGFTCELQLPEKLKYIGFHAFYNCRNLYGELHLPSQLEYIGYGAFEECKNLTGSLEIPQSVTELYGQCFDGCNFNGTLTLHDGITVIGYRAFAFNSLKGELKLPKGLVMIGDDTFNSCDFSGELTIPASVVNIGKRAFANNWRLMGTVHFPEGLTTIGSEAFSKCRSIEGLVFPESMENIGNKAFNECYGIGSIVCKGNLPAYVASDVFNGVSKDNFTLEVPESAIPFYQTTAGWRDFKRIAAHHELVCRPSTFCAINTEVERPFVLNAEGDWEVESIPDWCSLSQTSGHGKTELTLTIRQMPAGSTSRSGKMTFHLKGKDYTFTCSVNQYDFAHPEDEVVELQTATLGKNGGIDIVLLGDGYDAKDISSGLYMQDMQEAMKNFFDIEPFKTYRNYFNVSTAIALSPESGIGTVDNIRYTRFSTTFAGGSGLRCDMDNLISYSKRVPTVNDGNLNQTLIIVVPNTTDYGGICYMYESGLAIAICPKSTYGYPLDSRGVIQHEAGGHGFGKLADEYIYHNAFIDMCGCSCCGHVGEVLAAKSRGWYDNIDITGKMHEVTWSHLITHPQYSDIVDIFEGAFKHSRGVYRSEQNSCMNNDIPYYSTISRESIVRRIKAYAGEPFSFDDFLKNDKRSSESMTRATDAPWLGHSIHSLHHSPVILK